MKSHFYLLIPLVYLFVRCFTHFRRKAGLNRKRLLRSGDNFANSLEYRRVVARRGIENVPNKVYDAYVISDSDSNVDFIKKEWQHFVNVKERVFFPSAYGATGSHTELLKRCWFQRYNKSAFPVLIMEDDVYRYGTSLSHYWDQIEDSGCDYVSFDPMYVETTNKQREPFRVLQQHNGAGCIAYNQRFFLNIDSVITLLKLIGHTIDTGLTHRGRFVKCTPSEHSVRQLINKTSLTAPLHDNIFNFYSSRYDDAMSKLRYT